MKQNNIICNPDPPIIWVLVKEIVKQVKLKIKKIWNS